MIITSKWLNNHIDISYSNKELCDKLTSLGLECYSKEISSSFEGIIVGKVNSAKKIKDTDHLMNCEIDIGKEQLSIVCGAPNIAEGILVPVAVPGSTLEYGKYKIKKTKIRGAVSNGMVCSEKELGLSDNHEGIMILGPEFVVGMQLIDIIKETEDDIFEIDLTPNRGDCFSHLGIARELSAISGKKIKKNNYQFKEINDNVNNHITVEIKDNILCPRYSARVIKNVKVKESPLWLKERLEAIGQKSINNIVDAANYVLFDRGHPMHTFDLNKINNSKIIVKKSEKKQKIICLDGLTREVSKNHLMICDDKKPIAIAGIIGGEHSSVDANTTDIVIESAYFNPIAIRKGAKEIDLSTDASKRFERGTDIEGLVTSLDMLCSLIQDIAGGDILSGLIDIYEAKKEKKKISFDIDRCNMLLGTNISSKNAVKILNSLSIGTKKVDGLYECSIPYFRNDLERSVDLYEEIARVYGYDNINSNVNFVSSYHTITKDDNKLQKKISKFLSANGYTEHYSNSLISERENSWYSNGNDVLISNPLSAEMKYLRNSIIPGLVSAAEYNINHQNQYFKIFEIGPIHNKILSKGKNAFSQQNYLGICWNCSSLRDWKQLENFDIYSIKGEILYFFDYLGIDVEFVFKGDNISISACNQKIGRIIKNDEIKSKVFNKEKNIYIAEFNIDKINELVNHKTPFQYNSIISYPSIERDLAIQANINISYSDIKKVITDISGKLLESVTLFDMYKGKDISKNDHSLGISLKFCSNKRTLKDDEIDKIIKKIVDNLKSKFNVIQR